MMIEHDSYKVFSLQTFNDCTGQTVTQIEQYYDGSH